MSQRSFSIVNRRRRILSGAVAATALAAFGTAQRAYGQVEIVDWDFNNLTVGVNNTPAPSLNNVAPSGSASLFAIGMTNDYTYTGGAVGAVSTSDVLNGNTQIGASGDPASTNLAWRVRGQNPGNGWNLAAPQYSQGYQQPAPSYQQPPWQGATAQPIQTYLVPAILVTLFCFLPTGIAAIVYATQVSSKRGAGDYIGAARASKQARMWTIVSVAVGVVFIAIVVIAAAASSGSSSGSYYG